jgi:Asp-tRNA(Asn)/Glu-tRNA(Gln) amidotransferase A subunit family amidase
MTRTVRDAALMLRVIAGHDPRDSTSRDLPIPDYMAALNDDVRGVRIGIPRPHFFEGCSDATLAVVEKAIGVLGGLGARIENCELLHAATDDPRGACHCAQSNAPRACIRLDLEIPTMKQSYASAAKLRGGGSILPAALQP